MRTERSIFLLTLAAAALAGWLVGSSGPAPPPAEPGLLIASRDASMGIPRAKSGVPDLFEHQAFPQIAQLAPAELPPWIDRWLAGGRSTERDRVLGHALRRLALERPEEALRRAVQADAVAHDDLLTRRVLWVLAVERPDYVATWLKVQHRAQAFGVAALWYDVLAELDPRAALEFAMTRRELRERCPDLIRALASHSVADALEVAERLPASIRREALGGLVQTWAKGNPFEALRWVLAHPREVGGNQARIVISAAAARDPVATLAQLRGSDLSDANDLALLFDEWIRADVPAALAALAKLPPSLRSEVESQLVSRLVEVDPTQGLALAVRAATAQDRNRRIGAAIFSWRSQDEAGARAWILAQPPGPMRTAAIRGWEGSLDVGSTLRPLLDLLRELRGTLSADEFSAARSALRAFAHGQLEEAWRWASEEPDPARRRTLQLAAIHGAIQEPERAVVLLAGLTVSTPTEREDIVSAYKSVAKSWVAGDAARALRWATYLPDAEFRFAALQAAVGRWAESDPAAAFRWLASRPADEAMLYPAIVRAWAKADPRAAWENVRVSPLAVQLSVLPVLLPRLAGLDPATASAQVLRLPAGPERQEVCAEIARTWQRRDPAAARSWVDSRRPEFRPEFLAEFLAGER